MDLEQCTPSLTQAHRMKMSSQSGNLDMDNIYCILEEEKPNQKEQVRISVDKLQNVLPKGLDKQKTEDFIIKACDHYRKYLIRQLERER